MTDIAVHVEGLGKRYRLGAAPASRTAYDAIAAAFRAPFRRLSGNAKPEHIWALKNVTFDLRRGEVLGIIGRNGAGKSTLLKILSRITEPTEGAVDLYGRVSSLLEVGTGFHPELTGRENIFLNGAILGMHRAEIVRKFDEIVAFAEVERFLDTPVKHYSSGMFVRLAFAVAAHLEPEILLVDEVLAVGDAGFQKKCLGKMGDVAREGRTVLFVSHNMSAVLRLCDRVIHLDGGQVVTEGPPAPVVARYLGGSVEQQAVVPLDSLPRGSGLKGRARLISATLLNRERLGAWKLPFGSDLVLEVHVSVLERLPMLELGLAISTVTGFEIASSLSSHSLPPIPRGPGEYAFQITGSELTLAPGTYRLGLGLRTDQYYELEDHLPEALDFEILVSDAAAQWKTDTIRAAVIPKFRFQCANSSGPTMEKGAGNAYGRSPGSGLGGQAPPV
jgi:lipopolysaccharide transport system ATP-binding protein